MALAVLQQSPLGQKETDMKIRNLAAGAIIAGLATPAMAQSWAEIGDAGDIAVTNAQTVLGVGPLLSITGFSDATTEDKDVFAIWVNGGAFSANATSITATGGNDDTKLYLFDSAGLGVAGDDDSSTTGGTFDAGLNGLVLPAGIYYLAITDYNYIPTSVGGNIFPGGNGVGPTGPGGASPHTGWSADSHETSWNYRIDLEGASYIVPTPGAFLTLAGAGLVATRRRRV